MDSPLNLAGFELEGFLAYGDYSLGNIFLCRKLLIIKVTFKMLLWFSRTEKVPLI